MEREVDPGVFNYDRWENGEEEKKMKERGLKIEEKKKSIPCREDFSGFVLFKLSFCGLQVAVHMWVFKCVCCILHNTICIQWQQGQLCVSVCVCVHMSVE